jgi:tape measure domain-containing protein
VADLANLRIGVDSRDVKSATTDLNALGNAAAGTEQKATGLGRAFEGLRGVLAGIGFGLLAREAILMADTFTRMNGQLALVTDNAQQLAAAEKQLFAMSQNTRVGYESTVSLFSRLARSTENLGVSQQSVMRVTETINKAMIVSGTSAEQASGALMQLGQAFASGALRGDELNSVMEGMPRVAQAIAEGMGITVGELRKLGAQGKLTGAEVYAALLKMGNDIDSEFSRMPMTVGQSMTVLSNSLMLFVAEADRATGFTAALAQGIVGLSNNLNQIARVAQVVIVAVAAMTAAFLAFRAALGIQAIVAYISQLVAMQFALGATTTASALAGAGIKGLQAILASTGWGLAVVAIGAVVGAIYALVTAQSEARGETQNLINDLGRLAATQDKNYAQAAKRGVAGLKDVQIERDVLIERNKQIEAYTAKSGMVGRVAIEYKKNAAAIKEANTFLIQNGNAIIESNKVYSQTEPVLQNVSAAIEKTGKKAKEAADPLEKYRNALSDIIEEGVKIGMTPEQIKAFDNEKLALEAAAKGYTDYAAKIRTAGAATAEKQAQFNAQEIADGYLKEADAIGKTSIELKQLEINQKAATVAAGPLRDAIIANGAVLIANMKAVEDKKKADEDAQKAADEYKKALEAFNNLNIDMNFEALFGDMGKAMGGVVSVFDQIADRQEKFNALVKLGFKDEATRSAAQQRNSRLEINQYANLAGAAKGFFKEKSVGYKVMQAAETAFRAFEFAMSIKSIAMKGAEATATVAAAGTETAANTASGASKIFSQLGMWAFPVVAAMIAVMASLGGKGGSVSQPTIPSAEDMQAQQGAGSVLGDATAKSDSINRALEIMASNSNSDLEYSNQMLTSLRSIQNSMADLANNVAKQISVSGSMFDTSGQRLGSSGSGGFLGIGKTSTTRELYDLGIDIVSTSIAEIIAGGIAGNTYQVVQQVKKKSGFFGIGGGTKTTYQTTTGNIDEDIRNSITDVIASLRQGLIDGADVIGLDGAQAILDSIQVNIGRISLSGLSGSEIEEQLNAIFSKVGDEMAGALFPALTSMQRIGEGLFETFARVAREYQVVDVALRSIGKEFGSVGVASIEARSALVQMFESLDQFVEQTNYFRDNFLTEAEQLAPITQAVADELARLGLSSLTTIEQFKNAVLGLDLTSTAGQETYAALLQLAPAFKQVADYQAEIAKLQEASAQTGIDAAKINAENAKAALEIQQKRVSMEIQLLEAQGFASEALAIRRRLELAAMDGSLRALQEQIYAAQDATAAAQAAKAASDVAARDAAQQTNLEIQLMEAQGDAASALAARRALELAAMNETLGALQAQIYAAQDAKAAIEAATRAAQQAADQSARIATERTNLEIQLMEAEGNSVDALAARRAQELAALDESNRALQELIYAEQDAAAARDIAARAAEEAARAAEQRAQERAQAQAEAERKAAERLAAAAQLANDRRQLEIQLMEAQGQTSEALAARRAIELAGMDASLRGLQQQIYAAEDAREASLAAAEAAAQAAEEQERLAEAALALARDRRSLEIELLEAQGFAIEALTLRRAMELEAIDESLRGIQEQIWAAQAKAEADALAVQAAEDAAKALQDYADALANVSQTVIDEINRLRGINSSSSSVLLKAQFATLTAQARTGNLDALGKLPELSRSIEEATLGTATSALEVARIRAWLAASLSETLALQGSSDSMVNATSAGLTFDGNSTASANADQTAGELSNMSNVLYNALYQVARNTGKSFELLDRWDGDGLPDIREDASDYY